jgi:hypothetical protein
VSHTYNGEPISCGWCEAGFVPVVSSLDPTGKIYVHPNADGGRELCRATPDTRRRMPLPRENDVLRESLRAALELIDELQDGHKGGWSVEEINAIAEWRVLARED